MYEYLLYWLFIKTNLSTDMLVCKACWTMFLVVDKKWRKKLCRKTMRKKWSIFSNVDRTSKRETIVGFPSSRTVTSIFCHYSFFFLQYSDFSYTILTKRTAAMAIKQTMLNHILPWSNFFYFTINSVVLTISYVVLSLIY